MSDEPMVADKDELARPTGPGAVSLSMFLLSAVVLFGTVLAGYGLVRFNDPGAFSWAPHLLDRRIALAGAGALVVACLAAANAGRLAFAGRTTPARILLGLTLLAGGATLGLRLFELPSTSRRAGFLPRVESSAAHEAPKGESRVKVSALAPADGAHGKTIFLKTCAACHAPDGSGVKAQGASLRESTFVQGKTDDQLLAFVKVGRQPFDPETKLHLAMPARGGNPALTDQDLVDAIAHVRLIQKQAADVAKAGPAPAADAIPAAQRAVAPGPSADQPQMIEGELWLPHSILPAANAGPAGSATATVSLQKEGAPARAPGNVRRFFSIVLLLNGLHAIYLVFGLLLGAWTIGTASRGRPIRTSLVLVAAYWVVIGGIGLILVPALYL